MSGPDIEKQDFLKRACGSGDLDSCQRLGILLWRGWESRREYGRAFEIFVAACAKGHSGSCGDAGGLLSQGGGSVVRDHQAALVYLDKACTGGVALACSRAQSIFEMGDISPDKKQAEHYHKKALELGLDDP